MKREFPFPIPNGWFIVAYSDELAAGEIRGIHYFNQDLVLFRTESGEARIFDAHCPHLGAHLGYGGRVEGESVRCPFHAWRFDGEGHCVEVPYAAKIPQRARIRSWPILERNGAIFAWYHGRGEDPQWDIPDVPEYREPDWTEPQRREWIVRSRNQELAENTVDQAHFKYVHGTTTVAETEIETEGPYLRVVSTSKVGSVDSTETTGTIHIQTCGFGYGTTRFKGVVETLVVTSGAPIDNERVHMRLSLSVKKLPNSDATQGLGRAFIKEIDRQFSQDIPIWENKIHLDRPMLCDGDGPIGLIRRWGQQFYCFDEAEPPTPTSLP